MLYLRIIFCAVMIACCAASLPAPNLAANSPLALKSGQSVEVTLSGAHLSSIQSVAVLDARGVTATLVNPAKDNELRLKLNAAPDAAIGERLLRLIGSAGVTRPVRVYVSAYDVRPLGASDQQQEIQLPATITGTIATAGQLQLVRFQGRRGELLIFDVSARRSGSPLESVLTIQSESGRQIPCTLEHHSGDPLLLFTPPEDGVYILRLRDLRFRGGPEYGFRVAAGHIPYLESVLPGSGQPGAMIKAKPLGYNLEGAAPIAIDLTGSSPGRINVHANAALGASNEIPFEVTDLPQFLESEPNDSPDEANLVQIPVEISGSTDRAADEDYFRFRLPYKQSVSLEVLAARLGSPMVPLLQLRSSKGDVIEANDGTPESDGRIIRELDAGDYLASVRDLAYSGGPGHWYRLKIEPTRSLQPDFTVRFQPDSPRLHRGGSAAIWCEVKRTNGLRGDISLSPDSLPPGVSASPLTLPENGSGWLTLTATADAAIGTAPLRLGFRAMTAMAPVIHDAQPDTYLTVLEPAPFTIETPATLTSRQIDAANARLGSLAARLTATDPRIDSAQAQWEKKIPAEPIWKPLEAALVSSAKGAKLLRLSDSSILLSGNVADQDEYTVVCPTNLKGITAVRLEAIADERLPGSGPGMAPNGNFVLSKFAVSVANGEEPMRPVELRGATSDFAQQSFPASAAIDGQPSSGWAIDPQEGRPHYAIFRAAAAISAGPGTTLRFVLSQQSVFARHNLGRFRLSVTTLDPARLNELADVPPAILELVATPVERRSTQQRAEIAAYYRSIDPELASIRNQVAALRQFVGPYAELQRLEKAMTVSMPQFDSEQKQWEQSIASGGAWTALQVTGFTSDAGASLTRDADGSIFASGGGASGDVYRVTGATGLKSVSAIRLEALPDPRLPANGPGRADNGSFALTRLEIGQSDSKGGGIREVKIVRARATAEQKDAPVSSLVGGGQSREWSTGPSMGLPVEATFIFDRPTDGSGLTSFSISLHQAPGRSVGRFRLWVTSNPNPEFAMRVADSIAGILRTPDMARSAVQKRQVSEYFRGISTALGAIKDRIGELRAQTPAALPLARRNQAIVIPILVNRAAGFSGDVTVTMEGYAAGNPKMIARQIRVTPLVLKAGSAFGLLTVQPEAAAELATRMVVLKAEANEGDEVITQYTPAFPFTVQN